MAPAVTLDNVSDFNPTAHADTYSSRTLLLAPPSLSSHEEKLRDVLSSYDRSVTDLQMLDRLSAGLISLPLETYNLVLILSDVDGSRHESTALLTREVFAKIVQALKAGGRLHSQDNTFGSTISSTERTESILAGLMPSGNGGMAKPDYSASEAVPLRFGKKKDVPAPVNADGSVPLRFGKKKDVPAPVPVNADGSVPLRFGKRKSVDISNNQPVGVGFVDFSDDLDEPIITGEDDDDLIDEDTLLTEEDLMRPVNIPPECAPRAGKRRRACKDCSCGLAQQIEAEDAKARDMAEAQLKTLKLEADDLAEVDFTVQGKVGSCGNCSLGDAFRCDGCPYIGMPAFKPGEEVRLLNNDIQL